jgi:hypothetical protein
MTREWQGDPEPLRFDYESKNGTLLQLEERHSITAGQLRGAIKRGGWTRRNRRRVDRSALIEALYQALERQVMKLGRKLNPTDVKEVALLGSLARNLDKLMALEKADAAASRAGTAETAEMRDIRQKLAKRINELTKG